MHINTDDEVYRVDGVWLGPPNATFPWRARYSSYGIGALVLIAVMFVQRRVGVPLDIFSIGWSLVLTVLITRFVGRRIGYERPLGHVLGSFLGEITTPRRATRSSGGVASTSHIRVRSTRPTDPRHHSRRDHR